MFRFTLRELILVTATAGLATGWWVDHRLQTRERIALAELLSDREGMLDRVIPGWRLPAAERWKRGGGYQ